MTTLTELQITHVVNHLIYQPAKSDYIEQLEFNKFNDRKLEKLLIKAKD